MHYTSSIRTYNENNINICKQNTQCASIQDDTHELDNICFCDEFNEICEPLFMKRLSSIPQSSPLPRKQSEEIQESEARVSEEQTNEKQTNQCTMIEPAFRIEEMGKKLIRMFKRSLKE